MDASCYAIPSPDTVAKWVASTPPGFAFHFKAFGLFCARACPANALPRAAKEVLEGAGDRSNDDAIASAPAATLHSNNLADAGAQIGGSAAAQAQSVDLLGAVDVSGQAALASMPEAAVVAVWQRFHECLAPAHKVLLWMPGRFQCMRPTKHCPLCALHACGTVYALGEQS